MASRIEIVDGFRQAGVPNADSEADRVLELLAVAGGTGTTVRADPSAIAAGRAAGQPLEYLLGIGLFMGRGFECGPAALIPRAETELLAEVAIGLAPQHATIVDIGTGSGNLAVTLALARPHARVIACDISERALDLARRNVVRHGVEERVTTRVGDLFAALDGAGLEGSIDLVVCNPPYIPSGSLARMPKEILDSEPREAFDGGSFGLDILRRLLHESPLHLRSGGSLAFEIGAGQERLVRRLVAGAGCYDNVVEHRDSEGRIRVFSLERMPS